MTKEFKENISDLEKAALKLSSWIGTPYSVILHTLFFIGCFALAFLGFELDKILLILTTVVSLEAIYLAIFIQLTVNRNTQSLEEVEEDLDELQEDVEDISEDVEDITEDSDHKKSVKALEDIEQHIKQLQQEIHQLKKDSVL